LATIEVCRRGDGGEQVSASMHHLERGADSRSDSSDWSRDQTETGNEPAD
jgi:hypothetical protein